MIRRITSLLLLSFLCFGVQAQGYPGKTVRIIVGLTPGGFYDRWARLLARFMPLYIPGNPNFVVQNMTGGGSMIAANYLYNVAAKDGTLAGRTRALTTVQEPSPLAVTEEVELIAPVFSARNVTNFSSVSIA